MRNYARLVNSGYDAVKAVSSGSKVIVHVSNAYDNDLFQWNIGGLIDNGARFDVIGMSLYPETSNWRTLNSQALSNMNDMRSRYGKEIIMSEVGMSWDQASTCRSFLQDIISKTKSAGGLGLFYWEPEAYNWQGYTKGAWDQNTRRPTVALDAFIGASSSSSGSSSGSSSSSSSGGCNGSSSSSSGSSSSTSSSSGCN
jgi:arabinogalactan endo-1,4-beta-galactosidase